MPRTLTIELSDDLYESMAEAARRSGQTAEAWVLGRIRMGAPTDEDRAAAMAQLMRHVGAVSVPDPTGADNEAIDRDLAHEYGSTHEDER